MKILTDITECSNKCARDAARYGVTSQMRWDVLCGVQWAVEAYNSPPGVFIQNYVRAGWV